MTSEQEQLVAGLISLAISEEKARSLVISHPDRVERELEAFPHRDRSRMKDPAAWLIRAIENGSYTQPPKVEEARQKTARTKAEKRKKEMESQFKTEYIEQYLLPLREALAEKHPDAAEIYEKRCRNWDEFFPDRPVELRNAWKLSDLEVMTEEYPEFGFLTFWAWMKVTHPEG
jgi:hypothetical protein